MGLPGLAKGDVKLNVGPITFPKSIPGSFEISGTVKIQNPQSEQVTCIQLDLKIPTIIEDEVKVGEAAGADCTTAQDHIQNIVSTTDASGVTTTTMDIDEDLSTVVVSGEISVKPPIVPAIKVSIPEIPISFSPALPSGQFKFVDYGDSSSPSNDVIDVTGQVKLADGNGEQLTCIAIEPATAVVTVCPDCEQHVADSSEINAKFSDTVHGSEFQVAVLAFAFGSCSDMRESIAGPVFEMFWHHWVS